MGELSKREHYQAAGEPYENWGYPPFGMCLAYLWELFLSLHRARNVGMQLSAINYSDILAFQTLHNTHLSRFELEAIEILDTIALTEPAKLKKGKHEQH